MYRWLQNAAGFRGWAMTAVGLGLALTVLLAVYGTKALLMSYLCAFLFWSGVALGCGAILMVHGLVGGRWGEVVRLPMEAATATAIVLPAVFVPIALGLGYLYPWAVALTENVHATTPRQLYFGTWFFLGRAAGFLAVWSIGAWMLIGSSRGGRATGSGLYARV